jgi:hypothetical protein
MLAYCISQAFRLSALFAGLLFSAALFAEPGDQGSLEGTVTDPSGGVVPGTLLRATDQQRAASFATTTNSDGHFHFPVLPVGTYELSARHPGFDIWLRKDIEVTVGARGNLNVKLLVAGAPESVVVRDAAPAVETTRSQVSATVSARSISNLPVNGRNFLDFVLLTPGVTRGSRGVFDLTFGGQRKMNLVRVDGADNDNTFFTEALGFSASGQAPYQFSMASVQEFQVNSSSYSAELGRAGGGVINVVTRSGTNEYHGSAFWYYRDRSMNANDVVNKLNGLAKAPYHFNQFGGTLGGPLLRNKFFFFLTYDGQRSTLTNLVRLNLPAGFSLSSDPAVASFQRTALDYLTPRAASWLRTFDQDVVFARADWRVAPTHLLSGRWNRQRFTGGNQESRPAQRISLERTGASLSSTDTLAVSLLSSPSPSLANTFLFAYIRSREPGFSNGVNPEANVLEGGQLVLTIGRQPNSPRRNDIDRLQWSDVMSLPRGRHALKFGADVLPNWITFFTAVNFSGTFRFTSLESFGRSLAAAPPALPDQRRYVQAFSGEAAHGVRNHPDFTDYGAFAQDEWRLHPRLTLNLGLRYDLQVIHKPSVRNPSPELAAAGLDTSELRTDTNNLAPRLGIAWSPFPTDQLVLRAGYGIYFARTPSIITASTYFQNGATVETRTFVGGTPDAGLIPSYPNTICGPPDPSGAPPNCAAPSAGSGNTLLQFFAPRYTQPYTQQGSLGMEFQVKQDCLVSAGYLVVKGTHLQRVRDVNLGTPATPTPIGIAGTATTLSYQKFTLPRPITSFGRILLFESTASSIYHALVVTFEKRFSRGFQFSATYTFSKIIDDNPEPIAVNPGLTDGLLLSDASNPRADRASGVNDQRHRFVVSGLWQPRSPASIRWRPVRVLLSDWEFSGIFTAQTGLPYSAVVSADLNGDDNSANDRTPGTGRNSFFLPRMISLDPRVTRNIPLRERTRLQILAESFNILNHSNVSAISTTQFAVSNLPAVCGVAGLPCLVPQRTGVNALGVPTATSGPRIMQLAIKLLF